MKNIDTPIFVSIVIVPAGDPRFPREFQMDRQNNDSRKDEGDRQKFDCVFEKGEELDPWSSLASMFL